MCALASLCAVAPVRAAPDDARTVALLPLLGSGLALDELTTADAAIQREVDARYGERSLPAAVVRERLEEGAKRGLRCDRSLESCQAQLGIVCDTELVLIASLKPTSLNDAGGGFALVLRVVDVAEAAQLAFAASMYPGLPSSADIKKLIAKLDQPEARKAFLVVAGPSGAPVVVDGAPRGSLPLPKPLELAMGRHEVTVHTVPVFSTTTTLLAGLIPWFNYSGGAAQLAIDDSETRKRAAYLTENADRIEKTRIEYDEGKGAWETWAPIAVVTGSAALVVGTTILVVGLVALE